jgi:hypothetical protein
MVMVNTAHECFEQILAGSEDATHEHFAVDFGEPVLCLIQRAVNRRLPGQSATVSGNVRLG